MREIHKNKTEIYFIVFKTFFLAHESLFLTVETLLEDCEVLKSLISALSNALDNAQKKKNLIQGPLSFFQIFFLSVRLSLAKFLFIYLFFSNHHPFDCKAKM